MLENNKSTYQIELNKEQGELDISNLFLKLDSEECKSTTGINGYSLSDASLEDVFLNVSKINKPHADIAFDMQ